MARAKRKWYVISTDLGLVGLDKNSGGYPYIVLDEYKTAYGVNYWKSIQEVEKALSSYKGAAYDEINKNNPCIMEVEI